MAAPPLIDPYDEQFHRDFGPEEGSCALCGSLRDPAVCPEPTCPRAIWTEDEFERSLRP